MIMAPYDKTLFYKIFGIPFECFDFMLQNHLQKLVLVQCLTGTEIGKFTNISFEHPRGSVFRKYRSRTLAPVRFTNSNSNHRARSFYLLFTISRARFYLSIRKNGKKFNKTV